MNAILRQAVRWMLHTLGYAMGIAAFSWVLLFSYVIDMDRFIAGLWCAGAVLVGGACCTVLYALSSLYLLAAGRHTPGEDGPWPVDPAADSLALPAAAHPRQAVRR